MFRTIHSTVWAFDCEWVPDAEAGRRLLGLPPDMPEASVFAAMWADAGATSEQPCPFLKTYASRVASIAVVERRERRDGSVALRLCSLPSTPAQTEADLLRAFFGGLAKRRPQLVGFNSRGADLPVLLQRGLALGVPAPGLCDRPARPWEGPDYFWPRSEWHLDLMTLLGGRGTACPTLRALATLSGIPAKVGLDGGRVAEAWLAGDREMIRDYNESDAITTYLLWLRTAHVAGHLDARAYAHEEGRVEVLLEQHAQRGAAHHATYLQQWRLLQPIGALRSTTGIAEPTVAD